MNEFTTHVKSVAQCAHLTAGVRGEGKVKSTGDLKPRLETPVETEAWQKPLYT